MKEDMLRTNTPLIVPNIITVGQTVYEKSFTKNVLGLRQSKLNIPTILPYGGINKKASIRWQTARAANFRRDLEAT